MPEKKRSMQGVLFSEVKVFRKFDSETKKTIQEKNYPNGFFTICMDSILFSEADGILFSEALFQKFMCLKKYTGEKLIQTGCSL